MIRVTKFALTAGLLSALALPAAASAVTFKTLYSILPSSDGRYPWSGLTNVGGLFYGTTYTGGAPGNGIVFSLDPSSGKQTVIYSFTGGTGGQAPIGGLTNVGGTLFGVTAGGGSNSDGLVFKIDPSTGTETTVHDFGGTGDGAGPDGNMLYLGGLLYGVSGGGSQGAGTVFRLNPANGAEKVLYNFTGGSDGGLPGTLINIGTALYGSATVLATGDVVIYRMDRTTGAETVIATLPGSPGTAGFNGLTYAGGTLYVTPEYGGATNNGAVYRIDVSSGAATLIYAFQGGADGAYPAANMIAVGGKLYGTTLQGGPNNQGTAFALDPTTGTETVLHGFTGGIDGGNPLAPLTAFNGLLYGTVSGGGNNNGGAVVSLDPANGAEAVLHSFAAEQIDFRSDGLLSARGHLYFTAAQGGPVNHGAIVKLDPAGGASQVVDGFDGPNDAVNPEAALISVGGTFYGTSFVGGTAHRGTVYKLNSVTNTETVLYSFLGGADARDPYDAVIPYKGALYGTSVAGGAQSAGTIYKVDARTGAESVVHSFAGGTDGSFPGGAMIDVKGVFYGTTSDGETQGTIYKFNPNTGVKTTLYVFKGAPDGLSPDAALLNISGILYGTTFLGGANNEGTIFKFDPATGIETVLHSFAGDGANPAERLIVYNGSLYGTAYSGGPLGFGTVFKTDPSTGATTVLYTFTNGSDGGAPCAPLIVVASTLYGGTCTGGAAGLGTAFSLVP